MLDDRLIANIKESGLAHGAAAVGQRAKALQEMGFSIKEKAEYVLTASCFLPSLVPQATEAFRHLLDYYKIDYTLLPREYCCGNPLLRQAIKDRTGDELKKADMLAREFLENNLRQVRQIGAKKIIAFCVGCDLVYTRFKDSIAEEMIWYPTLLVRLFQGGRLKLEADYYAGCHYFYRKLNNALPDLDSATKLLSRIEGLRLNYLDSNLCCTRPQQLESLSNSVKTRVVITPCGGCASCLEQALRPKGSFRILMLPEVIWAALSNRPL